MRTKPIFIDLETTGFSAETDEILEIAIVDHAGNTLLDTLVKPERMTAWPEAQAVNGITPEMVASAPTLQGLKLVLTGLLMQRRVVAYHMAFDIEFLRRALPGLSPEQAFQPHCAMRRFSVTRGVWDSSKPGENDYKRWRQTAAAEFVGHEWSGSAHRALADVQACRSIWLWCDRQQAFAGWTPVAAGLPTEPGTYLVMLRENNSVEYTSERPVMALFGEWTEKPLAFTVYDGWYGEDDVTRDVTHWMPLPTTPISAGAPA